jgi:hypothetical protein
MRSQTETSAAATLAAFGWRTCWCYVSDRSIVAIYPLIIGTTLACQRLTSCDLRFKERFLSRFPLQELVYSSPYGLPCYCAFFFRIVPQVQKHSNTSNMPRNAIPSTRTPTPFSACHQISFPLSLLFILFHFAALSLISPPP